MASVNKLSLRGVRSFSPEDEEQVIEFFFPCTIIVGANGCGKTTIIESLKYAVTGGLPPGNKAGQAFVHDPRNIGQNQVKANVKLRFTSRSGQTMVVVRSMEVTQKKTNLSFKQLDGVLRMMDPKSGQRVSLSHKCSELDRQLPSLLGVSKPILEHVVFCHQEDASWPLQEGAVLKKRFDDIFDSTRYTKALDAFKKTEKEMNAKVKDLKIELAGLNSSKNAADVFRRDLAGHEESLEEIEEEKQMIASTIQKADKEIAEYDKIQQKIDEVQDRITDVQNELAQVTQSQQAGIKFLEEDMTKKYNRPELEQLLADFGDKISQQVDRRNELQDKYKAMEHELEKLQQQEMDLTSSLGKLSAEKEAQEQRLLERYKMMESIAQTYTVDLQSSEFSQGANVSFSAATLSAGVISQGGGGASQDESALAGGITEEDMNGFVMALDSKEEELNSRLKEHRDEAQAKDDELQKEVSTVASQLGQIETERKKMGQRKSAAQKELAAVNKVVSKPNRFRMSDIEEARKHAKTFAKQRDDANQNPRRKEIPAEIQQLKNKIETLKGVISNDKLTLQQMRSSANMQNEVTMLRDQCGKELEMLEEAVVDQAFAMQKHSIETETSIPREDDDDGEKLMEVVQSIEDAVSAKHNESKSEASRINEDVSKTQKVLSEKSALLNSNQRNFHTTKAKMDRLQKKVDKVRKVVEEIRGYELAGNRVTSGDENNPQALMKYLDDRLTQTEKNAPIKDESKVVSKVLKKLYKKAFVRDANGEKTGAVCCPCCRRGLEGTGGNDIDDIVKVLDSLKEDLISSKADEEAQAKQYEADISSYQEWKKVLQASMEDLRDMKRFKQESGTLQKDIHQLEKEVKQLRDKLKEDKQKLETVEEEVNEIRTLLDTSKRWLEDAARIAGKKSQVQQKAEVLTDVDVGGRDLETMEREMADNVEQKDVNMMRINELNGEMTTLNNIITDLATKASNTERSLREKETKFAETEQAMKRKKELSEELLELGNEDKQLQDKIAPFQQRLKSKETAKRQQRAAANSQERELQEAVNAFRGEVTQLRDLSRQIQEYSNTKQDDNGIAEKVSKIAKMKDKRKKEIQTLKPELSQLNNAVNDQERHKKQIQANIDVLEANTRIDELQKKIATLRKEMGKIEGADTVAEKLDDATARKEKQAVLQARIEGRFSEIVEQIRSSKRKLSSPEYKGVDEKYRVALINVETTQIASEDLKKYGNALDKSILKFHHVKIGDINKIIRELWMLTYKGEDITTIELVSGQEAGSRAAKSYNYRVVMTKGVTQLDMRGRCSAGQRVLASIVIRLALAETFCINCGCIALDEPTVNLDFRTKKGLAVALAQIIAARSQQRNFQLIMITHDEDFVAMMKTELSTLTGFSMPDKYFQVRREMATDGKFYSKINAIDWDEEL